MMMVMVMIAVDKHIVGSCNRDQLDEMRVVMGKIEGSVGSGGRSDSGQFLKWEARLDLKQSRVAAVTSSRGAYICKHARKSFKKQIKQASVLPGDSSCTLQAC